MCENELAEPFSCSKGSARSVDPLTVGRQDPPVGPFDVTLDELQCRGSLAAPQDFQKLFVVF